MDNRKKAMAAAAVALVTVVAGCGSSKSSSSGGGGGGGGGGNSITIGVLTDLTGPAASGNKTSVTGVEAGIDALAKPAGFNVKYVEGDSQTSPSGVNAAVQKFVQQDHVVAVISVSALAFAGTQYLTQHGIPVIGVAEDGPEWRTSNNMFSVYGALDSTKVNTNIGQLFKMLGVTTVGALGYSISPSSAEAAKGAAISSQKAGLKVGYVNANFPFGSTNVAPEAIAMKNAGVDGFETTTDPNTGFALINALRQLGDNPKVALLPDGYGGDLIQEGTSAESQAQGVYFSLSFQPVEMNTPATQKFQAGLKEAGASTEPTYGEYGGYASMAMLVDALKVTGPHPTTSSLMSALQGLQNFDAAGLLGSHTENPGDRSATPVGVDGCSYVTQYKGSSFHLVPNADPICGTVIPGVSVSS